MDKPVKKYEGRGGWRGGGRPKKVDEEKVTLMAQKAIMKKYGSIEKGLMALLDSGEPMLRRFVFEHAVGKPREKIDMKGEGFDGMIQVIITPPVDGVKNKQL